MKKFALALLALVLVLGLCAVASAADYCDGPCTWKKEVVSAATCLEDEVYKYVCTKCDNEQAEVVNVGSALGHHASPYIEESATCEDDGIAITKCDRCGVILGTAPIEATGHNYTVVVSATEGNCTTDTVIVLACSNVVNGITCGAKTTEVIEAEGHDLEKIGHECKPVTCEEDGFDYFICKNEGCDHTETKSIKHEGHKWADKDVIKEATCTADGEKSQVCSKCNATQNVATKAVGHKMTDWTIVHEASCEAEGLKTRYCSNKWCYNGFTQTSATEEAEVIPARGHKWTAGEVIKAATCTEKGETLYVCDCRATKVEEIAALGHTPDEWTVNAELGIKVTTCKVCKAALVEALAPVVPETPADPDAPAEDEDEDNNNSEGSGSTTGSGSDASIPATGDNTSNVPYIMMVAAVAGLVVLVASKRKVNC